METAPVIDGTVGEAEWSGAATAAHALVVIATNQPSGDRGQYWIGYDAQYVYVAARIHLANGAKVKADEFRDNVDLGNDDAVTVILDVGGNAQEFNQFSFNAAGATQLQLAGGRAAKREWGGSFESRGRVFDGGWEGEARIPWATIPIRDAGPRDLKFLYDWNVSSTQRGVSSHSTQGDLTKIHVLRNVDVPAVKSGRNVLFLPYAYAGAAESGDPIANGGVDIKARLSEGLNGVMTVNPDFRNIESEILDLDFSNFERLPGESRPFFLEGNEFLLTGGINNRRLFASQRVGSFDAGVNLYGSLSPQVQIGALGLVDVGNEHSFVGSLSYAPNQRGSIFASISALDRPGQENTGTNLEYFQRTGDYLLFAGYQHTADEVEGAGYGFGTGWQYVARGVRNVLIYEQVSPDFLPRLGFAPQRGFRGATSHTEWTTSHPRGAIMETTAKATYISQDKFDGGHYREVGSASVNATLRNALSATLSYTKDHFLSDVNTFRTVSLQMPRNDRFRGWSLSRTDGEVAGTEYASTTARIFYRPVKRLQLDLRYQKVEHAVDSDQTVFTLNWELDKFRSLGGRLVRQDGDWNWFLSYKMSGNLGAEYFLILGDPNATRFQKTLVFKVSVPFATG